MQRKPQTQPGDRYEYLEVLRKSKRPYVTRSGENLPMWWCRCRCNNKLRVLQVSLRSGNTGSCGCLQRERTGAAAKTHGQSHTKLYRVWNAMRDRTQRTTDKHYKDYGGRGIRMHKPWRNNFSIFAAWIAKHLGERPSPKHSLDRRDNDGHYEPGNLRWATAKQQTRNQRSNHWVKIRGVLRMALDVAVESGVSPSAFYQRVHDGWSVKKAATQPMRS